MGEFALYTAAFIAALVFVAMPVIYFGRIDVTSAFILASGAILLIWIAFRKRSQQK